VPVLERRTKIEQCRRDAVESLKAQMGIEYHMTAILRRIDLRSRYQSLESVRR
jgi:hypothetical protein